MAILPFSFDFCVGHTDVRNEHSVAKLFEENERKLGTPHILVNNAGIGGGDARVAETTTEEWDNIMKTDLYGRSSVVGNSSASGGAPAGMARSSTLAPWHAAILSPGTAAYRTAKGGLRNLLAAWAIELAPDPSTLSLTPVAWCARR